MGNRVIAGSMPQHDWTRLRPVLRGVANTEHVHLILNDFIYGDVRPGRKHKLACVAGQADAPTVGNFRSAATPL
jgi:hypothetical protein